MPAGTAPASRLIGLVLFTLLSAAAQTSSPAPQKITFRTIPPHSTSDAAFNLVASATSGLPVSFVIVSGPAIVNGASLQITGLGNVTVEASQNGNADYLPAAPVSQSFNVTLGTSVLVSLVNAASYVSGTLASGEYVALFGSNLATANTSAPSLPLPTTLGGASLTVTDSANNTIPAFLNYVSPSQFDFVVPSGLALGPATVTLTNSAGYISTIPTTVALIAPGLFTADSSGTGVPAALLLTFAPNGSVQVTPAFLCAGSPPICTAYPANVAEPGYQVFLSLYGTGLRGNSGLAGVKAVISGNPVPVLFAGPQPADAGLDQINIALPPLLAGTGPELLQVTIDGVRLNPVTLNFQ